MSRQHGREHAWDKVAKAGARLLGNIHDESYNLKGTPCPTCQKELVAGALDTECKSCMRKATLNSIRGEGEVELASGPKASGGHVAVNILEAHAVVTEELTWLWWGRILGAKITFFAGLGDCGKSTVLIDLIARVTTASPISPPPDSPLIDANVICQVFAGRLNS